MTLIDGFNLIYKFPDLEAHMYKGELKEAMNGLIGILEAYGNASGEKITVCFDGKKAEADTTFKEKKGKIKIYYSQDYSADAVIKELVKKDKNPRMLTVVSSDNGIRFFIKPFGVTMLKSEEYREKIEKAFHDRDAGKPEKDDNPVITDEDISFWERMFKRKN